MRLSYLSLTFLITLLTSCHPDTEKQSADSSHVAVGLTRPDTSNSVKPSVDNPDDELPVIKNGLSLKEIIPEGYNVYGAEVYGQLNDDTLTDCALVINTEEMDSKVLVVLFKTANNTYNASLITTDFITVRYDNELVIENKKLFVHSDHPWHGTNLNNYELRFVNNDWFCFRIISIHDYANQSWRNELDFVTGKFSVSHEVTTIDDKTHTKKVEGVLSNVSPFKAGNGAAALEISYQGEKYYMWDRNDLWSEDQIIKLLPKQYQEILGLWSSNEKQPTSVSIMPDGNYTQDRYYEAEKRYNYTNGIYIVRHDSIILDLDTLRITRGKSGTFLTDQNEIIYTKDED